MKIPTGSQQMARAANLLESGLALNGSFTMQAYSNMMPQSHAGASSD